MLHKSNTILMIIYPDDEDVKNLHTECYNLGEDVSTCRFELGVEHRPTVVEVVGLHKILDGNPGTRGPGHRRPGPWSQDIFFILFFYLLAGAFFLWVKNLSVIPLYLSFYSLGSFELIWISLQYLIY